MGARLCRAKSDRLSCLQSAKLYLHITCIFVRVLNRQLSAEMEYIDERFNDEIYDLNPILTKILMYNESKYPIN